MTGRIDIPGGLTVSTVEEGNGRTIEVDQMELLAAVGVVTGIAGDPPVSIQMVGVGIEIGVTILAGHIGFIIVAVETKLLIRNPVVAAVDRRIIGLPGEKVKPGRTVRSVTLGSCI